MALHTVDDYKAEIARVDGIIAKSTRRAAGQWITYKHRLMKQIEKYKKNNYEKESHS